MPEQPLSTASLPSREALAALDSQLALIGLAIVPVVPTPQMMEDGYWSVHDEDAANTWKYMLAAGRLSQSAAET